MTISGGIRRLRRLLDVDTTGIQVGNTLTWDGTKFVDGAGGGGKTLDGTDTHAAVIANDNFGLQVNAAGNTTLDGTTGIYLSTDSGLIQIAATDGAVALAGDDLTFNGDSIVTQPIVVSIVSSGDSALGNSHFDGFDPANNTTLARSQLLTGSTGDEFLSLSIANNSLTHARVARVELTLLSINGSGDYVKVRDTANGTAIPANTTTAINVFTSVSQAGSTTTYDGGASKPAHIGAGPFLVIYNIRTDPA